jgi:hypothetical protein
MDVFYSQRIMATLSLIYAQHSKAHLKRAKYPSELWKQAVELTEHFSKQTLSNKLGVHLRTLEKQVKKHKGLIEPEIRAICNSFHS